MRKCISIPLIDKDPNYFLNKKIDMLYKLVSIIIDKGFVRSFLSIMCHSSTIPVNALIVCVKGIGKTNAIVLSKNFLP